VRKAGAECFNGHFESTCFHPLLLFNRDGDCLAAKLRPGNMHSAVCWEEPLLVAWFRQLDLAPFDGLNWPHLEGM
jgi:hypothetical protein